MRRLAERLIEIVVRWPGRIAALALLSCALAGVFVVERFAINTDTARLIAPETPWRAAEDRFDRLFPGRVGLIVAVLDAASPECADAAADRLVERLNGTPSIQKIHRPDSGPFFDRNGFLLQDEADFKKTIADIIGQQPFLSLLAADPGLGGVLEALRLGITGVEQQRAALADLSGAFAAISAAIEASAKGEVKPVSWRQILSGQAVTPDDLRRIVLIQPKLDFAALQPGAEAIAAIRATGAALGLHRECANRLRLTGPVPLADEEFATVAEGAVLTTIGTILVVLLLLMAALRAWKLVLAVMATLLAGLVITAGLGLALVGEYNLISVAFAVLFVGLGVDFSIQLVVRYREIRLHEVDLGKAIRDAALSMAKPLLLAAASTAIGFFAFLPTAFKGVSELGLIAGFGMMIALLASLTLLPALLKLLAPAAEHLPVRFARLDGADRFIEHHRKAILGVTALIFLAGLPLFWSLRFDSNPMNLRDQKVESVATFHDLAADPQTSPMTLDVLAPDLGTARLLADRLSALPEVARVTGLFRFLPQDQDARLAAIADASILMDTVLEPVSVKPPRDQAQLRDDIAQTRAAIAKLKAGPKPLAANEQASVDRLDRALAQLAKAPPEQYQRAQTALIAGIEPLLKRLRSAFEAETFGMDDLPATIRADWVGLGGQARLEVAARGNIDDPAAMARFVEAVRAIAPDLTGPPITILESGRTVVKSFLIAAALALVFITLLLFAVLRKAQDVIVTLVPLVVAVMMSLQAAVLLDVPLNFANIIALPLMCGVSVAFHIYFVLAWRQGATEVLGSSLTRAILFSALTTATAFGSLWLSSHPGTASMGKLLTISLFFTLLAAFVFVPAFLGPPEAKRDQGSAKSA